MKRLLSIAVFIFLSNVVFAQVEFGIKGGLNISQLNVEYDSKDHRLGPLFGAFAEIGISDKFIFQPELIYSIEGTKDKYDEKILLDQEVLKQYWEEDLRFDFLNIPLLCKYKFNKGLSVLAGPQIGYLLKADLDVKNYTTKTSKSRSYSVRENFKKTNISFCIGTAWEPVENIGIDIRYCIGLSNIESDKTRPSSIQMSLFYKF